MIAFETHGAGPTLVLVHGVGLDRRMWARCLPALARAHRVVLVDLPGHGRSAPLAPGAGLDQLAGVLSSALDGPAHVAGFSLGALVAAELAVDVPELVTTLTLVSAVADRSEAERTAVRARLALAETDFPAAVQAALDRWFAPGSDPELVAVVRATLLATDRASYLAAYRIFAEADAGLWPRLGAIEAPTLAVTGGADRGSTPAMARSLAGAIPDAAAAVLPGARHLLALERPDELADLILTHTRSHHGHDHAAAAPSLHRR